MVIDTKTEMYLQEIASLVSDENDAMSIFTLIEELNELYLEGDAAFHSPVESDYQEPKKYIY